MLSSFLLSQHRRRLLQLDADNEQPKIDLAGEIKGTITNGATAAEQIVVSDCKPSIVLGSIVSCSESISDTPPHMHF
ncbi:unnamed protein product [Linum trigynum]|uniref:Uncharacterized protein n=1 Tax=Linum trigynum TaxID=586398 RepID=A0AAV2FFD0_9ROSI